MKERIFDMKNSIKLWAVFFCITALIPTIVTGCTDNSGDGIDSVLWEGSRNPENTKFRNPVWEPSLEAGTLVKGPSMYAAVSAATQWSKGITKLCPTLTSTNLMSWTPGNDALTTPPTWAEGRVNSLSIDYARAVTGATYWMFYTLEGSNAIAVASANTAAGPYTDRGSFISAGDVGSTTIQHPFFIVVSTSYYLCYTVDDGTYMQRVSLNRVNGVSKHGAAVKIAGPAFKDVAIVRISGSRFYLLGTVDNGTSKEIRYAMGTKIIGPYKDKAGVELTTGSSTGELLITSGDDIVNPENPMRGFTNNAGTHLFIGYNATQVNKNAMTSGYLRRPFFITPFEMGDDGWFTTSVKAAQGWTLPRFN